MNERTDLLTTRSSSFRLARLAGPVSECNDDTDQRSHRSRKRMERRSLKITISQPIVRARQAQNMAMLRTTQKAWSVRHAHARARVYSAAAAT